MPPKDLGGEDVKNNKIDFNRSETDALLNMFNKLTNFKLDRLKFREVLHSSFKITDDLIMDRIFSIFSDKDKDNMLGPREWLLGMSIFLRANIDDQIDFCFKVYDLNHDGTITREEIFTMLKNTVLKQLNDEDPEEGIRDLVEIILKKFDERGLGKICKDDFRRTVKKEVLLLEAFGQCLPDEKTKVEFMDGLMKGRKGYF